jgi:hypothetical protein
MNAGTIKKALAGITVVAASIVTVAGTASAAKNTGGYQRSSAAHKQQWVDPCPGIWNQFEKDVNSAGSAADQQGRNGFLTLATMDLKAGQAAGCDWASRVSVPQASGPTTAPASTVG